MSDERASVDDLLRQAFPVTMGLRDERCGWIAPSGNVCIKPAGHTGNHKTVKP